MANLNVNKVIYGGDVLIGGHHVSLKHHLAYAHTETL